VPQAVARSTKLPGIHAVAASKIHIHGINIVTSIFVYIVNMRAKLLFLLLLRAIALHADDVSGRWSGTLTLNGPNGAGEAQPYYLILNQNDAILSGSAGKDERSQSAIGNGRVTPDGIQFDLGAVSLRLRLNGGELVGTG
jgi:hypothetical protein